MIEVFQAHPSGQSPGGARLTACVRSLLAVEGSPAGDECRGAKQQSYEEDDHHHRSHISRESRQHPLLPKKENPSNQLLE
jgi:hypothetical protein